MTMCVSCGRLISGSERFDMCGDCRDKGREERRYQLEQEIRQFEAWQKEETNVQNIAAD